MSERQRPHSKVSLEDLLRLKRAERPQPEFWAEFEAQLRHKQLAAIVDKRPWWRRFSTAGLAKLSIPVGATAVIAFTLVTFRDHARPATDATALTAAADSSSVSAPDTAAMRMSASDADGSSIVAVDPAASAPSETSGANSERLAEAVQPSVENIAGAVASQSASEPSLAQVILGLEGTTESDAHPQYEANTAPLLTSLDIAGKPRIPNFSSDEANALTQVSAPRDDRRARLLASVDTDDRDLVSGNPRVARSRERIANRLAEQSLYDSISRLGLSGDSVSIKF